MNRRARNYLNSQAPVDPERHARMLKLMLSAETSETLHKISMMYLLDMSYSRQDIAHCIGVVEREKGWA